MPNWYYHNIDFKSPDDKKRVRDKIFVERTTKNGDAYQELSFSSLIPIPESLYEIEEGTSTDVSMYALLRSDDPSVKHVQDLVRGELAGNPQVAKWISEADKMEPYMEIRLARLERGIGCEGKKKEAIQNALKVIEAVRTTGYTSWYFWCIDNWDTKWDACDTDETDTSITFRTAWSAPRPFFEKLIAAFPDIWIDIYGYEEQGIEFTYEILSDGTGNVYDLEPDSGSEDAKAIYVKCKGTEGIRFYDGSIWDEAWYDDWREDDDTKPTWDELPELGEYPDFPALESCIPLSVDAFAEEE